MVGKSLRTVTDRFSLVDLYRKHTAQNGRNYMLDAVERIFTSPETQERIKLGEAFGYYGHGRREQYYKTTGSIKLPETSVIMVEGQPIIVDNVPSNRTLDIRLNRADGIVTHTQEILDTPTGNIVDGMERSMAGGWSWATKGGTQAGQSIIREYAGMDYVGTPNFLSLDRMAMMNESGDDEETSVIKALMGNGMTQIAAETVYNHFRNMRESTALFESAQRAADLELELFAAQGQLMAILEKAKTSEAMLESVNTVKKLRRNAVEKMLANLPYHVTDAQRTALINMETEQDLDVFTALFESVSRSSINDLPIGRHTPAPVTVRDQHDDPGSLTIMRRGGSLRLLERRNR